MSGLPVTIAKGAGFFDERLHQPGKIYDKTGVIQVPAMLKAFNYAWNSSMSTSGYDPATMALGQAIIMSWLNSQVTENFNWRRFGIGSVDVILLEAIFDEHNTPLEQKEELSGSTYANFSSMAFVSGFKRTPYQNRSTVTRSRLQQFNKLFEESWVKSIQELKPLHTGDRILDAYAGDMVTALRQLKGLA